MNFLKKKQSSWDAENSMNTKDSSKSIGLNTEQIVEKAGFDWISRIKVLPVGILSLLSLLGAIATYANYSNQLDKNRQKTAYISDLRQLSERIEKSALLVRSADSKAFDDLNASKNTIDQLLQVLKEGGKIKDSDTIIEPMPAQFSSQFNKVTDQWDGNKALISTLVSQKKNLVELKDEIAKAKKSADLVLDNSITTQKALDTQSKLQATVGQELLLLSSKINQGFDYLFSGESFSLEKGYALVKDLKFFNNLIQGLQTGNESLNLTPVTDPNALAAIQNLSKAAMPYVDVTSKIIPQIENLSSAKEVARQVSGSSKSIVTTAEELNTSFVSELGALNKYKLISIALFFIALIGALLLALVFYERSLQAFRLAKVLQKSQANENAVNTLLGQITPLDEGDFSQKVYVEDKFVLPISERIDATRKRFGDIVRQVKFTSDEVLASAQDTENTSQKLLQVSGEQFQKMGESITNIGKITSEIDELSQITWMAQEESKSSRQASIDGDLLVRQSIQKMDEIRYTIQESSKKIKKLGESAQSITEVTGLIQDITKQINVLALNAAIQAASSGESGREFTIVAQEVQRLAFDSENATKKIAEIIAEIQSDTATAVASMEKTTQEVVTGAQLTDKAGDALKEIEKLAQSVAERVADAAEKLEQKSSEMANFAIEMKSLQTVTQESSNTIRLAADQVESLKAISQKLDDSVNVYKVE